MDSDSILRMLEDSKEKSAVFIANVRYGCSVKEWQQKNSDMFETCYLSWPHQSNKMGGWGRKMAFVFCLKWVGLGEWSWELTQMMLALIHFSAFLTTKSLFLINLLVIGITRNFTEMTDSTRETSLTLNTNPICLSNLNTTFFLIEHKKWREWKYPSWNEAIPL